MNTNKPKVIIDTDPGHDDVLAILMAVLSNKFDILAITTVAGNATIEKVTRNAQAILNELDSKVPVYSGFSNPLERELVTSVVHGESGVAGFDTSATEYLLTADAPEKIIQLVRKYPGEVTILAFGPLSNVARAIQLDSRFASNIKQLVIMGGAIDVPGNKIRVAEFNFFVDPDAASVVMQANIPKVLVPLDICNNVVLKVADFKQVQNKRVRQILLPMMRHFEAALISDEGTQGILVYDALAAYYLLRPEAYVLEDKDILIETKGEHTSGMCVVEKRLYKSKNYNVKVVTKLDDELFRKDLFEIINRKK